MNFSILISLYSNDNEDFLDSALSSITVNQTLLSNDIVVVKDGELTESLDRILSKYLDLYPDRISVYGYETNRGLGYALDFGLLHCKNEIVFRMDADDISIRDRFQKQVFIFESHPDVVLLGGIVEEFNVCVGDLRKVRNIPLTHNEVQRFKSFRNPFNHMSIGFKKSYILEVGGYKSMHFYEDYYLWLRVLKYHKGINLNEILVHARVGDGMIERRQGINMVYYEILFQLALYKEGLQSLHYFFRNILFRAIPRLLPVFFLKRFYNLLLRK
ncbi:MAG: glycosyltransferase [Cytophagales bacterium]|nr:glycosyltransferase [Cytophagales bacterium]